MSRFIKSSVLAVSFFMVVGMVAGCSSRLAPPSGKEAPSSGSSLNAPTNGLVQSNTGGGVTIDIEWMRAEGDSLVFNVVMNTHSVDLDQYDLMKLAILRDDASNDYHPVSWDAAPGGHHRQGTLIFPLPDSASQGKAKYLEMVIRDVAGIKERLLKWELQKGMF